MKNQAAGEKFEDLTIKVQKLERDVKQLRSDSMVIELFARQKFGFVRSGDVVIKVSQDQADAVAGRPETRPIRMANLTAGSGEVYTDASN